MNSIDLGDLRLHVQIQGPKTGPAIVFSNSLGTDLRLWDQVVPLLPPHLRLIRYDTRGHGLSDCPPGPYSMGALVRDAERLLDVLAVRDCVFVGLSIGGLIAQGLATKRLDQVRALVLSNTASKIGTKEIWQDRIEMVETQGLTQMSAAIMERWFSKPFQNGPDVSLWRRMVETTPTAGYAGCCAAIAGTDFYTTTAALRLPTLVIAGSEDGATPPDLVRETADLIPGSRFEILRGTGHLPCVEDPVGYAALLTDFFASLGLSAPASPVAT
jgi:3-oxoadipate enol-lactonase